MWMQPHDAGVYTKSYVTWNLGNIATYLQVPVYYSRDNPSGRGFKWKSSMQVLGLATEFRQPCVVEDDPMHPNPLAADNPLCYYDIVQRRYYSAVSSEPTKVDYSCVYLPTSKMWCFSHKLWLCTLLNYFMASIGFITITSTIPNNKINPTT